MGITESDWAQISPTQGPTSPKPGTLASAAVISPTTFLTILTGNVAIATINPPVPHGHMLAIQFAGTAGVNNTGNVLTTTASVVGQCMLLVYNPSSGKYVPVG